MSSAIMFDPLAKGNNARGADPLVDNVEIKDLHVYQDGTIRRQAVVRRVHRRQSEAVITAALPEILDSIQVSEQPACCPDDLVPVQLITNHALETADRTLEVDRQATGTLGASLTG